MKNLIPLLFLCLSFSLPAQFGTEQILAKEFGTPNKVMAGDLDGDGDLDLLVGFNVALVWYENLDGSGSFSEEQIINGDAINYVDIHLEDMDGDGDLDILTATENDKKISWYCNDGAADFGAPKTIYVAGNAALRVFATDIDLDGDMDVLAGHAQYGISVSAVAYLLNDGAQNFANPITIDTAYDVSDIDAADVDGDGDIDVAASFRGADKVFFYENTGNLNYTEQLLIDNFNSASGVSLADMNNDGLMEVLAVAVNSGNRIFTNTGNNVFEAQSVNGVGAWQEDITTMDVNNDGYLDAIVVCDNRVTIIENNQDNTYTVNILTEGLQDGESIHTGDINGDGYLDIVCTSKEDNKVAWHLNDGAGYFGNQKLVTDAADFPFDIDFLDMDGDNDLDILTGSREETTLAWFENLGNGSIGKQHVLYSEFVELWDFVLGDIDGDGDTDIICAADSLRWFENVSPGNFVLSAMPLIGTVGHNIQLADLDGDNDLDLLSATDELNNYEPLTWHANDGTGSFEFMETIGPGWYGENPINVGDIDNDGDIDILTVLNNETFLIKNLGNGNFQQIEIGVDDGPFKGGKFIDIDGDLDLDIVLGFWPGLFLYENLDGTGNYSNASPLNEEGLFSPAFIITADLNNDFQLDIIAGSTSGGRIAYVQQNDPGLFSPFKEIHPYSDSLGLSGFNVPKTFDFDNDGDLDVFAVFSGENIGPGSGPPGKISLFENYANNPSLSGVVFWDENENGIFDNNENLLNHIPVSIDPQADYAYSDENGRYHFYVNDSMDYTLSPVLDSCWEMTTPPLTTTFDGLNNIPNLNFGLTNIGGNADLDINLISAPTRCGFTVPFWLTITNNGCTPADGRFSIVNSDLITFIDASPSPDEIIGDTLYWDYELLISGEQEKVRLNYEIAGVDFLGEFIEMPAIVFQANNQGDLEIAQQFSFASEINCAYDPNDKSVYPQRNPEDGFDQNLTLFDEDLLYTIRFQNTGTDTAFNIVIRDQLSANLDWTTFLPGSASHPFETTLHDDGLVEFNFRSILLVDSLTNEPESHGFVSFHIRPKDSLAEMTSIENVAAIYFDYNPPIITNIVENVMVSEFPVTQADFDYTNQNNVFDFEDNSSFGPISWAWTFGDGGSSEQQNPTHSYAAAGNYEVCLTAANILGEDSICKNIVVPELPVPEVDFNWTSDNSLFLFEDQSTNSPNSWSWDFGDGNSSDQENPSHSYAAAGNYDVCLTVANEFGADSLCKTVEVIITSEYTISKEESIQLFPSPTKEKLTILFDRLPPSGTKITIKNSIGQSIGSAFLVDKKETVLDVSQLSPGVYVVVIYKISSNHVRSIRFVIL